MSVKGFDTINRTLTGKEIKAAGGVFACRYTVNAPGAGHLDKELTAAEVKEKTAAGVRIVCNFEWATVPDNTVTEGKAHAQAFLAAHKAYGGPDWAPCYWSADSSLKAGALDNYAQGWADTVGPARCGVYGDGALYRDLKAKGLISLAWQSMSRSFPGNGDTTGADIIQTGSGMVAGHSCDFDTAVSDYYGGWLLGEDDPMALSDADKTWITQTITAAVAGVPRSVWGYDPNDSTGVLTPAWRPDYPGNVSAAPRWWLMYGLDALHEIGRALGIDITQLPAAPAMPTAPPITPVGGLAAAVAELPTTAAPAGPMSDADVARVADASLHAIATAVWSTQVTTPAE